MIDGWYWSKFDLVENANQEQPNRNMMTAEQHRELAERLYG